MTTYAQRKKALQLAVAADLLWGHDRWVEAGYDRRAVIEVANSLFSRWALPGTRVPQPHQTDLIWRTAKGEKP